MIRKKPWTLVRLLWEIGDTGAPLYNKHTFTSEGIYKAWAEVKDIYGRELKSNPVTITHCAQPASDGIQFVGDPFPGFFL